MDTAAPNKRVIAYVDGFNLYFGLRDMGWRRFYWLDIVKLARSILETGSELADVKYFTARVSFPEEKRKRQSAYLEALEIASSPTIIFGKYRPEAYFCQYCYQEGQIPKEKMTDVNIAVEMMTDAFQDRFDTALLISGDSDLTPPALAIRRLFPEKRVIVAFPPKRSSVDLIGAASAHFTLIRTRLRDAQMPDEIMKSGGAMLKRPDEWK